MKIKMKFVFGTTFFIAAFLMLLSVSLEGGPLFLRSQIIEVLSSRAISVEVTGLPDVQSNPVPTWTLIDKIGECKEVLKNSPKLEFIEKKGKITKKQISLCIVDMETGEIFERRYWLDQKQVERANSLRRNYKDNPDNLPVFSPVDPSEEFKVITNWWNNWNSDWRAERTGSASSDNYAVAANKFLVPNSYIVYPEEKTGPKYSDIIYAPYSELIHTQEIVQKGIDYMTEKVSLAFLELRNLGVGSRAFPGQLVADTVTEKFAKEILVNEQTDPDALFNKATTDEEKRRVLEKVFIRYGLNGDRAFRYTVSKTGASGMAQIMATTYSYPRKGAGMVQKYPSASLIKDVELGRLDPINAVKTEVLVFDDKLTEVKATVAKSGSKARKIFESLTVDQLDEVRAMGYNGGSSKYNVLTGGLNMRKKGAKETKGFLEKLRVIRYLKVFE